MKSTSYSVADLRQRHSRATSHRDLFNDLFDDCFELAMPRRMTMSDRTIGQEKNQRIFDETAVTGVQEFASKLQSGIIPGHSQWLELRAGMEVPEEAKDQANREFAMVSRYVFEVLNGSNFSGQAHETFLDLSIGTGNLLFEETTDAQKPFKFTAIGLPHYAMDCDPSGDVDVVFRDRKMDARRVLEEYPGGSFTFTDANAKVHIVDCVVRDTMATKETWQRVVFCQNKDEPIYTEEYTGEGSCPYIIFRWSKTPQERYGRGPLMDAISSIKTLNLTIQLILQNAQMAIAGVYNVEDDGQLNVDTIKLVPGALIPHAPGGQGLRPVPSAGRFDVAQILLSEFRMNVRRALFLDMLGDPDKTPASATEVAARQSELAARIGASYMRLHYEFVLPVMKRAVYILRRKGLVNIDDIDGKIVKAVGVSPLAKRFMQEDVMNYTNYAQSLIGLYGPQIAQVILDQQAGAEFLADRFTVDPKLNRDEDAKAQIMQMIQQGMQQQEPQVA